MDKVERIPLKDYANQFKSTEKAVIYKIKAGILDGVQEGETWYVLRRTASESDIELSGKHQPGSDALSSKNLSWITIGRRWKALTLFSYVMLLSVCVYMLLIQLRLTYWSNLFLKISMVLCVVYIIGCFFEGIATGIIRTQAGEISSSESPFVYILMVLLYMAIGIFGMFFILG